MQNLTLRDRLSRLGPVRDVARAVTGSPQNVALTLTSPTHAFNSIAATHTLAYYGLPMIAAKRAVEDLMATGMITLHLPLVDDPTAMVDWLTDLGLTVQTSHITNDSL